MAYKGRSSIGERFMSPSNSETDHTGVAHPTPLTYVKIAVILAVITAVEVALFYIPSIADILVPLFIVLSLVKFALVAMYYMHLKFDERIFSALFVGGLLLATCVIAALLVLFGVSGGFTK